MGEELRLRYRYLDLRKERMRDNVILRHAVVKEIRDFLSDEGYLEVETPIMTRSTPEGARDFLVPSRLSPGSWYALPQSPQLFKQLLMIGGYERYFQIARCFRDEDFRADRQPEFTQLDMELAFVEEEDVYEVTTALLQRVLAVAGIEVSLPLERMTYDEVMLRYGSDRPGPADRAWRSWTSPTCSRSSEFKVFSGAPVDPCDEGDRGVSAEPLRCPDREGPVARRQGARLGGGRGRTARGARRSPSSCPTTRSRGRTTH